ncbi:18146_t:CDS:2, partial [Dentiscutata erythropus]
ERYKNEQAFEYKASNNVFFFLKGSIEGQIKVTLVGIDNVFLGVRNTNNEIPYSVGTLKKIEDPVMLSVHKKDDAYLSVNNDPNSKINLKKIIENPGRPELYTAGKLRLELVFNESGGTGFQENFG